MGKVSDRIMKLKRVNHLRAESVRRTRDERRASPTRSESSERELKDTYFEFMK